MCQLSWNLGALTSWNPQGLSRAVMGLLYILTYSERAPSSSSMQSACAVSETCHIFSTLSHKRHDFRRKVIKPKMCVLTISTTLVWNFPHSKKNSAKYRKCTWVLNYLLFLSDCNSTLKAELNPVCHLLPLLGAHHILHVSRIRVKLRLFSKSQKNIVKYK